MNQLSSFDVLLIAHLIGDYLLQTEWMAKYKAERWWPLLAHCFVYTLVVGLISFLWLPTALSWWAILLIFVSHVLMDRRGFVFFWYRRVMRVTDDRNKWLMIMVDQTFHLIILAIAVGMSG
ncbi:DUF3307 domain-containing protein [Brevibacillus ruminantium]|uniref:DUF3307 domain-containing protein n=1 Tax=Brevibacillus ruminantium TaxID=2950604 RepID=A0ABY4WDE1_9BACL|nr:DUF3307 domain-containing protein [Brevibacillus ruminantium]USG63289.1 DUF3307 domain-containing protein [Brevibacillus ruminantium]